MTGPATERISVAKNKPFPKGWRWVKLGEVCEINPSRPSIDRAPDQPTTFIPMEAVDAQSGSVTASRLRSYGEIQKGYTYFAEGDVLFAKITPFPEQKRIAAILNGQMAAVERARKASVEELEMINTLPAALLRRAFAGEL